MNQNDCFFSNRGGKILILALLLVALFAIMPAMAGGGLADGAWPKFGYDAQNTGQSPYVGSQTGIPKWSYYAGSMSSATFTYQNPVIGTDGIIYICDGYGTLHAIYPDGSIKWQTTKNVAGWRTLGPLAIGSDNILYAGSYDTYVYAIYPENGSVKWRSPATGANIYSSGPAIGTDGTIYIGSDALYAFDPQDGSIKWKNITGTAKYATPAIGSDGTIYIGSQTTGTFYAYNPDGTLKWSNTSGAVQGSAAIGLDGTIYAGSTDTYVYAWNPDGTLKWKYPTGGAIVGSPAIGRDGTIYIGNSATVMSFNALNPDGTLKWTYPVLGYIQGTPAIGSDGTIYIGSWTGSTHYAINPDGILKWSNYISGEQGSPAIATDGTVYFACKNKYIYAYPGVVDFTADQTVGPAPLAVQFTGSSPLTVTGWHWDFGDGFTSDEQNPSHTYTTGGVYTVSLTITSDYGSNTIVKTDYISAYSPPIAAFTSSATAGASPLSVTFTDQTTGAPTGWLWDFGDGTTSTEQNPVHIFTASGSSTTTYTINLTATNMAGSNTISKTDYITLYSTTPVVSFTGSPRVSGAVPLNVQFKDTSTLAPTSWLWDFGDGTTSTEQNPVHTYSDFGSYPVTLTATNAIGSSTELKTGYINIVTPAPISAQNVVNLYMANDEGIKYDIPDGVPVGTYQYVPNTYFFRSTGGLNALSIYDGVTTTVNRSTAQSGTFYVTFGGGQDTMHDAILMLAVNGTIPDDFSVHIRSSGYNWTLPGGPGTTNLAAPAEYNYVEGAVDETFTKDDFIYGPQNWKPCSVADYPIHNGQDMSDTENTFRIMFIDLNVGHIKGLGEQEGNKQLKVEYSFNNLTSFAAFNDYGWYIASNHGTAIIMTNDVGVGSIMVVGIPDAPVAGFTSSTDSADIFSPVQFTDTSANVAQSWLWEFGDGTISTEQNPTHTYAAPGTFTVNLTVTNYKGTDKITKTDHITKVISAIPTADFTADEISGISPLPIHFTDKSTGTIFSQLWDFGDGVTSTEQNPVHWYAPGTYTVNLTVTNSGGSNSKLKTNLVIVSSNGRTNQFVNPGFETGDLSGWIATGAGVVTSTDVHNGNYALNTNFGTSIEQHVDLTGVSSISFWNYRGVTGYGPVFQLYIDDILVSSSHDSTNTWTQKNIPISGYSGVHLVTIAYSAEATGKAANVDDIEAITDATIPVAVFTASQTSGTVPLTVTFTDTSTNTPTSWAWDFDGDSVTDSMDQSPSHTFTTAGTYTVTLTATNADGSSTATTTINAFSSGTAGVIPGYTGVYVRAANDGGIKYDYAGNGMYYINENGGGLNAVHISTDPAVSAGQVTVSPAQSGTFYVTDTGGRGYQDNVVLMLAVNGTIPDDFTAHIKTSGYTWTPSTAMNKAPATGEYTYQSTALDETFTKNDFIYGPQNWKPSGSNIIYPIFSGEDMSSPANQYQLAFIDTRAGLLGSKHADYAGLTDKGAVKVEYSFSNLPSYAAFNLYAWNRNTTQGQGMGWTNRLEGDGSSGYSIYVRPSLTAAFTSTQGTGAVQFTDASTGSPVAWAWDFGDGATSAEQSPLHTYANPGTYTVKLTVTNAAGATADATQEINVEQGTVPAPEFPTVAFPVMVISAIAFLAMVYRKVDGESP